MTVTLDGLTGLSTPGISNSEGYTGDGLTIAANAPAGAATIDTSGNLGLGVTPSAWGTGNKAFELQGGSLWSGSTANILLGQNVYQTNAGGTYYYKTTTAASMAYQNSGAHQWYTAPSGTAGNAITFTQAMTLDASGNLLVGQTSTGAVNGIGTSIESSGLDNARITVNHSSSGSSNGSFYMRFAYGGTVAGTISQNSTTTVAYNTSSDYRLKENIQPMAGALAKVAKLKPVTYTWKATGQDGQGFIAHELQEVVPDCVTGQKDAVETYTDENGNEQIRPIYQGIDTSFLVATLTAAIQEQQALITALTARIEALEAK